MARRYNCCFLRLAIGLFITDNSLMSRNPMKRDSVILRERLKQRRKWAKSRRTDESIKSMKETLIIDKELDGESRNMPLRKPMSSQKKTMLLGLKHRAVTSKALTKTNNTWRWILLTV